MKKSTHYFSGAKKCKMLLATPASIVDCTPSTLMNVSGGAYATTDKRFLPNGTYSKHTDELPPSDALDLPAYVGRATNLLARIEEAQKASVEQKIVEPDVEKEDVISE